uniref:uncharacterized protein LOC122600920 isoform X1 n=1 Tax=Erigeron canadensis TaxID=72917 RepID=UPI001CB9D27D|nr:uncharacterized protein LOC122600920 isoform X1 [Erigeron canadensis]
MQADISGLRHMIKEEIQSAYYSHCFVHQLQTTLVAISQEKVRWVGWYFYRLDYLTNVLGFSWKDSEISKESRFEEVSQAFEDVPIEVARYLNQKVGLERLNHACWRPYHKLVLNVIEFYPVILDMLDMIDMIKDKSSMSFSCHEFDVACEAIVSFDFIFMTHVMKTIFEVMNELNIILQKKDEEIVSAMSLVKLVKEGLQGIRDVGWEALLTSVNTFCRKHEIKVLNMEDMYVPYTRRRGEELRLQTFIIFKLRNFMQPLTFTSKNSTVNLMRKLWSYLFVWAA